MPELCDRKYILNLPDIQNQFDIVAVDGVVDAIDGARSQSHVTCNERYVVSVSLNQDFNIDLKVFSGTTRKLNKNKFWF